LGSKGRQKIRSTQNLTYPRKHQVVSTWQTLLKMLHLDISLDLDKQTDMHKASL